MSERLHPHQPEVMVFTEAVLDPADGAAVYTAESDYGYAHDGSRRKVLCWVRDPRLVTSKDTGFAVSPSGRFVRITYDGLIIDGWCIPWRDAHVRSGRRDRLPWEEHQEFLRTVRGHYDDVGWPDIIAGDFNQRIPRHGQPAPVFELLDSILNRYHLATAEVAGAIYHIAVRHGLFGKLLGRLSKCPADGKADTDHEGYVIAVARS